MLPLEEIPSNKDRPLLHAVPTGWNHRTTFFFCMVLSGIIPPLGMMFLLWWPAVPSELSTFLSRILYLGSLTSILTRCGIDQWAFSRIAGRQIAPLDYAAILYRRVLPCGVCVIALAALWIQEPFVIGCLIASAFLDAPSAIRAAELTARCSYYPVVKASWVNLPLFIVLSAVAFMLGHQSVAVLGIIFITTSLIRFLILFRSWVSTADSVSISLPHTARMAQQQLLNFVLFRLDALTLSLWPAALAYDALRSILYLLRVPELAGNGAVLITSTLSSYLVSPSRVILTILIPLWIALALGAALLSFVIGPVPLVPLDIALAVAINTALVLPAHYISQVLLARNQLLVLLMILGRSIAAGAILLIALWWVSALERVPWVITFQLLLFIMVTLSRMRYAPRKKEM